MLICNNWIDVFVSFILIVALRDCVLEATEEFCFRDSTGDKCKASVSISRPPRFLFYDVNYPEGFNLRRDVYMRLAIFLHSLASKNQDWHLVLPPWNHLYHWKSKIGNQTQLPWSTFFDIESMQRFAPVMDLQDMKREIGRLPKIDIVYYLQHFKNAFSDPNWDWSDKWEFSDCDSRAVCLSNSCGDSAYVYDGSQYKGWFWGMKNLSSYSLKCVSFQGPASLLTDVIISEPDLHYILVDHAEVVLHDRFGDRKYWECRRSMRFAEHLVRKAREFRYQHLGSNDTADRTLRPTRWEDEKESRDGRGGPYVCGHLRRGDFTHGRAKQVPSLDYAAEQLKQALDSLHLDTVFLATDASPQEEDELRKLLLPMKMVRFKPSPEELKHFKDGGVAIIDQIICSYARFFIGTHESTFTFRIQEEREIIGFPIKSTFNLFCANPQKCFQSSKWTIVF